MAAPVDAVEAPPGDSGGHASTTQTSLTEFKDAAMDDPQLRAANFVQVRRPVKCCVSNRNKSAPSDLSIEGGEAAGTTASLTPHSAGAAGPQDACWHWAAPRRSTLSAFYL